MSTGRNAIKQVCPALVFVIAVVGVVGQEATTAQEATTVPASASSVLGVTMTIGRGLTPVLAEPRRGAPVVTTLVGIQPVTALATEPGLYRPAERRWVLVDLEGARTTGTRGAGETDAPRTRAFRYGWVGLKRFGSGEPPRTEALLHGTGYGAGSGVLLHHPPGRDERPREMFYLDVRSGSELPLGVRRFESRIITILPESEILVTSMGTGPGNPQPIDLIDLSDGSVLFAGFTWSLHDAIRENRYVRVIPGRTPRDTPGYLEDPHPEELAREPYNFGREQLEEYRALWEIARDRWYESIRIIPQVWLDTHTGEMSPVEYTISRYVEQ